LHFAAQAKISPTMYALVDFFEEGTSEIVQVENIEEFNGTCDYLKECIANWQHTGRDMLPMSWLWMVSYLASYSANDTV
jgi:hypothetical protein